MRPSRRTMTYIVRLACCWAAMVVPVVSFCAGLLAAAPPERNNTAAWDFEWILSLHAKANGVSVPATLELAWLFNMPLNPHTERHFEQVHSDQDMNYDALSDDCVHCLEQCGWGEVCRCGPGECVCLGARNAWGCDI